MSRLEFRKTGKAIYSSHLDLMRTMRRAFIRAGLPIQHSEGFNPHANISIALPLPLGHESCCELMDFELQNAENPQDALLRLNAVLPDGIEALRIYSSERPFKEIEYLRHRLELIYDGGVPAGTRDALAELYDSNDITVFRKTKKSEGDFNIAPCIKEYTLSETLNTIICESVLTAMRPMLNPTYLIAAIEKHVPEFAPSFVRYLRVSVLDAQMHVFE